MLIKELYAKERPVVSFEIFPPKKDAEIEGIEDMLARLSSLSPDFISVTYGAGSSGNVSKTAEIAASIQRRHHIPALAHMTCVGADSVEIRRLLDGMRTGGISNILALRGDLPPGVPPENACKGAYQYAEDLIREISPLGDFCVGAACYPEGHIDCDSLDLDIQYLLRKQEAGAEFFISQLFFDNNLFFRFLEKACAAGVTAPISAGVMPILGRKQIERMIFMCGVSLPSDIVKLLHKYENDPDGLIKAGIEHAARQLDDLLRQGAQGVHIYTMNKPDIAEYCMKYIGRVQ